MAITVLTTLVGVGVGVLVGVTVGVGVLVGVGVASNAAAPYHHFTSSNQWSTLSPLDVTTPVNNLPPVTAPLSVSKPLL